MKYRTDNVLVMWLLLAIALAAIVLGPLATIWALNTLFHTGIPYAVNTWVAVFLLGVLWRAKVSSKDD